MNKYWIYKRSVESKNFVGTFSKEGYTISALRNLLNFKKLFIAFEKENHTVLIGY